MKLRNGLADVFGKSGKVRVQGKEVKVSDMLASFDALIAATLARAAARGAYRAAVDEENARFAEVQPLLVNLRSQLRDTLSEEQLATLGIAAKRTKRALSPEERMAKMAKNRATRDANGTRGARQRRVDKAKAVLATVLLPTLVGDDAPASPTATSPPAAATPSNGTGTGTGTPR